MPEKLCDKEICLEAIKQNGLALEYVPKKICDREICLETVKQDGYALKYVPGKFCDREICLEAVKQNGNALEYVPKKFQDEEIYFEAIEKNEEDFIGKLNINDYGNYPTYEDINIVIGLDYEPLNPRYIPENFSKFAMYHKEYDYGDKKEFSNLKDLMKFIKNENCEYLNVYMLEHGFINFSTSSYNSPKNSGQVGVIYVTPSEIIKQFGKDTSEIRARVRKILKKEIEAVDAYASGQVYGFIIETPGGEFDSCGGFYGYNSREECIKEALSSYKALCENFASPEAMKNFIKKDKNNYKHIPREFRTLEASKQYIKAGGDIESVPSKHIKNVTLKDDTSLKM